MKKLQFFLLIIPLLWSCQKDIFPNLINADCDQIATVKAGCWISGMWGRSYLKTNTGDILVPHDAASNFPVPPPGTRVRFSASPIPADSRYDNLIICMIAMPAYQTVKLNCLESLPSDCVDENKKNMEIACFAVYDPVCGCDGKTYGNECEAEFRGGVTSWTPGPCKSHSFLK